MATAPPTIEALRTQTKRRQPAATAEVATSEPKRTTTVAASRQGLQNIAFYALPQYKRGLRLVQAKTGCNMQSLMTEALNDLFRKHGVPALD